MATLTSLKTLLIHELKDLYSAENQLLKALPKMSTAATESDLKEAFDKHLKETQQQVTRLENIFSGLNERPEGEHCNAMEGLIKEAEEILEETGESHVKDAALIAAAQRVEHYEMAGYGSAHTYAKELDFGEAASLLKETLNEEKSADKKLNKLATGGLLSSGINKEAQRV